MKRAGKMLVIGLFSLLLSGCMFTTPETSLYRLPKLAGEYESLESQIDALLTDGAEYTPVTPLSFPPWIRTRHPFRKSSSSGL